VDNCCIDISDNTCRSVQFLEGLYPCILHNSMATFGDNMTVYTPDTRTAILARHALYNEGSLYKIIESGGNRQMLVGCLTKDGSYGVIVSASLAQIETAAEVMRSVLIPVAIFLIALNLLVAALFSRWFTRPMRQLSDGAREIADGNYDVQVPVVRNDELGLLGREFNHMAQEVKRSAQLEKDILANVQDVRMQQLRANRSIVEIYAKKARACRYDGLFAVVSDPVEPLCNAAWQISNCNESGAFDDNGLHLEQVQGYGLGVMNARAVYYAKKNPGKYGLFLTEGRVFGPHGKSLVVADSITQYHDKESRELSKLAAEANLSVRALGFKPYIAPALSSAAISILLTMRGADHYGSVALHEIYFGCKNKYTKEGLETECQELPGQLYERIRSAYRELEEISDNC